MEHDVLDDASSDEDGEAAIDDRYDADVQVQAPSFYCCRRNCQSPLLYVHNPS